MPPVVTLLLYCTGAASDVDWMIEIQGDRTKDGRFEGIIGIYDENNPRRRQTNPSDVAIDVLHASEESRTLSCIFARKSEEALVAECSEQAEMLVPWKDLCKRKFL
jgi:hypothetical protein